MSFSIEHRVGIKSELNYIYECLTTTTGLAGWWTSDTQGNGDDGSILEFRFNDTCLKFIVSKNSPLKAVEWTYQEGGHPEWEGTKISFQLVEDQGQVFVRFAHSGWKKVTDFMAHCSTKWAVFLLSLKDFIEKGKGSPFPNDVQIDHC